MPAPFFIYLNANGEKVQRGEPPFGVCLPSAAESHSLSTLKL